MPLVGIDAAYALATAAATVSCMVLAKLGVDWIATRCR